MKAGLIAGAVFLLWELLTALFFGVGSPFGPAHVTLHGLVGAEGMPGRFDPGLVAAALLLHFALSVVVTIPLALLLHPWEDRTLIGLVSGVFGFALYVINVMMSTPLAATIGGPGDVFTIVGYVGFGIVGAWMYGRLKRRPVRTEAREQAVGA